MNIKHKLYTGRVAGSASEGTERRGQSGQGTIALGLTHSLQKFTLQVHKWTHCSREGNKMCAHRCCVPRICVFTGPVCVHTESANSLGPAHSTRVPHCCAGAKCSLSLQGGHAQELQCWLHCSPHPTNRRKQTHNRDQGPDAEEWPQETQQCSCREERPLERPCSWLVSPQSWGTTSLPAVLLLRSDTVECGHLYTGTWAQRWG